MSMFSRSHQRGFSLVEMLVSMVVLGIVMSIAAMELRGVIYAHLYDESHLSVEQQARVAMAKVDEATRQASVVDPGAHPVGSPSPAVLEPLQTPGPRLVFTQVSSLDNLPVAGGVPQLCYNVVTISLGPVNTVQANQLLETIAAANQPCGDETQTPLLLARNVQTFQVTPARASGIHSIYLQGYQVDLSIFDSDDNQIDQRAGATYHLSSIVSPLQFGEAQ